MLYWWQFFLFCSTQNHKLYCLKWLWSTVPLNIFPLKLAMLSCLHGDRCCPTLSLNFLQWQEEVSTVAWGLSKTLPWSLPSALSWLLPPLTLLPLPVSSATQVSEQGLLHAADPEGLEICPFFHQPYLTPGICSSSLQEMIQYLHVTCTQPPGHCKPPLADPNIWHSISTM